MSSRIGRLAALFSVAAAFAVAAPASAPAHHIPTCDGIKDPACNVNYFTAHQVTPVVDEVHRVLARFCYIDGKFTIACIGRLINDSLPQEVHEAIAAANQTVVATRALVDQLLCEYIGAC